MTTMNDFLTKHGAPTTSSNAWIFPDKCPSGQFVLVGFDEKQATTGTLIPVMKLQDKENGTVQCLSLWSCDKTMLADLEVQDVVTLKANDSKTKIELTKVIVSQ